MELRLSGEELSSVFALNGLNENSATYALGWTMMKSPALCEEIIYDLTKLKIQLDTTHIELQKHMSKKGFTDIEVVCPGQCHVIIEAKVNWVLPSQGQLLKYAKRITSQNLGAGTVVSLSGASQAYAKRNQASKVGSFPLVHRSWTDIRRLVQKVNTQVKSNKQKLWLNHLNNHLGEYVSMQKVGSNSVYVVSLSWKTAGPNPKYSFVDVVVKDSAYFHPVGATWPVTPPNYIGFRYDGVLKSVHHIESYDVVTDLSTVNKNWPVTTKDHFVYKLGPVMLPSKTVKSGPIRAMRVTCAIDTLLSGSFQDIRDARNETNRRLDQ